jgi:hypothetical protein
METNVLPVISGAQIGVLRLKTLIAAAKLERLGMKRSKGPSATAILKRELGVKGDSARVIAIAELSLSNVAHW